MKQIPLYNQPPTQPSTTTAVGGKIHVRLTQGQYQTLRRLVSGSLLSLYFGLVWIQVDGQPWLLFDFSQHRITLFGIHLSWFDLPLMAGLMIAGTTLLFLLAVGWGRLWCGFACPQSIWSWLFIRIELWTEGRASHRRAAEKTPLKGARLSRRILKHLLWVLFSLGTALTFTGYFIPIREIIADTVILQLSTPTLFWLITMGALTYLNGGLVREKVCFHMCPYSRFQGVMFDSDTRTVTYDRNRGEPRVFPSQPKEQPKGDCIDCGLCVQVCPTGIDIRDGLQYECIDCAACIDACDNVMDKIGLPRGLIAFQSEHQTQNKPSPLLRPRLLTYLLVTLLSLAAVAYGFINRTELLLEVRRDRQQLFQQLEDGRICNLYRLKVEVFADMIGDIEVSIATPFTAELIGPQTITPEFQNHWFPYRVCTEETNLARSNTISFVMQQGSVKATKESAFITGAKF